MTETRRKAIERGAVGLLTEADSISRCCANEIDSRLGQAA